MLISFPNPLSTFYVLKKINQICFISECRKGLLEVVQWAYARLIFERLQLQVQSLLKVLHRSLKQGPIDSNFLRRLNVNSVPSNLLGMMG